MAVVGGSKGTPEMKALQLRKSMMSIRMLAAVFFAFGLLVAGHVVPAAKSSKAGADSAPPTTFEVPATSVATFHCLGIYWSPENGQAGKNVLVKFRKGAESRQRHLLQLHRQLLGRRHRSGRRR